MIPLNGSVTFCEKFVVRGREYCRLPYLERPPEDGLVEAEEELVHPGVSLLFVEVGEDVT